MNACRPEIESAYAQGDFTSTLTRLAQLRAGVDLFFDKVMVMAEDQALRRKEIFLKDWADKLDAFLGMNDRQVLDGAGAISHKQAVAHAQSQYEQFAEQRRTALESEGENFAVRMLEAPAGDEQGLAELGEVSKRLAKKKGKNDGA